MNSVHFRNDQQVVNIEDDGLQRLNQPTRVPLDRMTSRSDPANPYGHVQEQLTQVQLDSSREERSERQRVRKIFERYDTNRDGYLERRELSKMMKENPNACTDLPKGLAKAVLSTHDADGDGRLDFEEFFSLSQQHKWLVRDLCVKYCRFVVPLRNGGQMGDETVSGYSVATANDSIDGAYENQMRFFPPPLTMVIFSIIEVIFFVIDVVQNKDYSEDINRVGLSTSGPMATIFIYNPWKRYEAWRFVTYMFVHVGVMHIMMNLIVQLFLGTALELVHCWWRVALVYLSGVLAGSMGTSLESPNIFLAGASGGVYALITAHIATIIMNWKEMEYALIQLFVFLVFCTTDIGFSIYRHQTDPHDKVGYIAHLCGGIAGLLVGIGVLRNLKERPFEKKLWWFAVTTYSALMITGICIHIFYPDHFLPSDRHFTSKSGV